MRTDYEVVHKFCAVDGKTYEVTMHIDSYALSRAMANKMIRGKKTKATAQANSIRATCKRIET